jgi:hypothetical protein
MTEDTDIVAEHAELLGREALAWNDLTHILAHLFEQFSGLPRDEANAIFFTPKSDSTQRAMLRSIAEFALKPHPKLWQELVTCRDIINNLSGERNAAMHTSWAVTFPEPRFVPAANIPVHKRLKPDFVTQFKSLQEQLNKQFFVLNEIRKSFEKQKYATGRSPV